MEPEILTKKFLELKILVNKIFGAKISHQKISGARNIHSTCRNAPPGILTTMVIRVKLKNKIYVSKKFQATN